MSKNSGGIMKKTLITILVLGSIATFAQDKNVRCDVYKGSEQTDEKIELNLKETSPCGYGRVKMDNEDGSYYRAVTAICAPQFDDSLVSGRRLVVKIGSGGEWDTFSEVKISKGMDTVIHSIESGISVHCKTSL